MIEADRIIKPTASHEDEVVDRAIRPKMLADCLFANGYFY